MEDKLIELCELLHINYAKGLLENDGDALYIDLDSFTSSYKLKEFAAKLPDDMRLDYIYLGDGAEDEDWKCKLCMWIV